MITIGCMDLLSSCWAWFFFSFPAILFWCTKNYLWTASGSGSWSDPSSSSTVTEPCRGGVGKCKPEGDSGDWKYFVEKLKGLLLQLFYFWRFGVWIICFYQICWIMKLSLWLTSLYFFTGEIYIYCNKHTSSKCV